MRALWVTFCTADELFLLNKITGLFLFMITDWRMIEVQKNQLINGFVTARRRGDV
jgi:hypothetical protein